MLVKTSANNEMLLHEESKEFVIEFYADDESTIDLMIDLPGLETQEIKTML